MLLDLPHDLHEVEPGDERLLLRKEKRIRINSFIGSYELPSFIKCVMFIRIVPRILSYLHNWHYRWLRRWCWRHKGFLSLHRSVAARRQDYRGSATSAGTSHIATGKIRAIVITKVTYYYYAHGKEFFRSILYWAVSVIFFYAPGNNFSEAYCFQLRLWFSFFFFFFFDVDTITLERRNLSERNFLTWLLTEIAHPSSKMAITGQM